MEHAFLDKYAYADTPIHRLSAPAKVASLFALSFAAALAPRGAPLRLAVLWAIALLAFALARLPWAMLLKRLALVLPLPAVISAAYAFSAPAGTRLATFAFFVAKSLVSVVFLVVLVSTTPFPTLLAALKSVRTPDVMLATLSFFYRYVFILQDEFERGLRARALRANPSAHAVFQRATYAMAAQLALRSFERSERVYQAMRARGYAGRFAVREGFEVKARDAAAVAFAAAVLAATLTPVVTSP